MRRVGQFTIIFALLAALLAACAGASAPAAAPAAEAPAAEEAAPAAQESAASDVEMPQPDPADQAQEATPAPGEAATVTSPLTVGPAVRTFQLVPGASTMQYFVEEEFFGQAVPFITAVGQTTALTGSVALRFGDNGVIIDSGVFTADISTLTSDRPRRDQAIPRTLAGVEPLPTRYLRRNRGRRAARRAPPLARMCAFRCRVT
jgi:hypothetical protein